MFVINTAIPDPSAKIYVPTRIVLDDREAAEHTFNLLHQYGYDVDASEINDQDVPERSIDEKVRAEHLMWLLFLPAGGHA